MRNNEFMQVLWIENDPLVTEAYPREAEMAGIELHPYPSWEEARSVLERDYKQWDAIILDAKCKYLENDADKADRFLMNVLREIQQLASEKNSTIPWYVLSGQGEDDIRDLIPESGNDWNNDWAEKVNRRFYSKNGKVAWGGVAKPERLVLLERIKIDVTHYKFEFTLENNLYPDVFKALKRLDLGDVGRYLMDLLSPVHFKGTSNKDYNNRYAELRKSLEQLFRHMVENGILPGNIIERKGVKEEVKLSLGSLFLGRKQPKNIDLLPDSGEKRFWNEVKRNTETPLLPDQLGRWLKSAVFQTGGAVHTSSKEGMSLENYLPQVGGSPYMLRSLTMGLCDFILWYDHFVKEHPDKEKNMGLWTLNDNPKSI